MGIQYDVSGTMMYFFLNAKTLVNRVTLTEQEKKKTPDLQKRRFLSSLIKQEHTIDTFFCYKKNAINMINSLNEHLLLLMALMKSIITVYEYF